MIYCTQGEHANHYTTDAVTLVGFTVFNTTFNNISAILWQSAAILWQSVFLVEETGEPRENH
jgi:hypothetical protein